MCIIYLFFLSKSKDDILILVKVFAKIIHKWWIWFLISGFIKKSLRFIKNSIVLPAIFANICMEEEFGWLVRKKISVALCVALTIDSIGTFHSRRRWHFCGMLFTVVDRAWIINRVHESVLSSRNSAFQSIRASN